MKKYVITEGWTIFDTTNNEEIELVEMTDERMFLFDNDELHTKHEVEKMIEDAEGSLEKINVEFISNDELKEMLVTDAIKNMADCDLIEVYNSYCEANNYYEDRLYWMSDLDELVTGSASQILNQIDTDCFNPNHNLFYSTIYGYKSCDYVTDCDDYFEEELIDCILKSEDDFGNDDLKEILNADAEGLLELYEDM